MEQNAYIKMYEYEQTHWWFVARRAIIKSLIEKNFDLDSPLRILEIGSGTGGNYLLLSSLGKLTCVEPNKMAADLSIERYGHTVINKSIESLPTEQFDYQFDLIVILDVVEHIQHPSESLKIVNELLSDKGKILITTPAYQFLWGPHDIEHHHHRRYSKSTLTSLLQECELSIQKISYFNTILFPLVLISRLVNKVFKRLVLKDSAMPSKFINGLLQLSFSFERHILTRINLSFGCSLLAICARKCKNQNHE